MINQVLSFISLYISQDYNKMRVSLTRRPPHPKHTSDLIIITNGDTGQANKLNLFITGAWRHTHKVQLFICKFVIHLQY